MAGQYATEVRDSLSVLVGSQKWADVKFIVGRSKTVIPAHRAVLAAQSRILEAMVYPTLGEAPIKNLEIQLPTVEPPAFRAMLRAIYTDNAKLNEDIVHDCLELATRFDVEILRYECAKFLKNGLTVQNVCTLFESAPKLLGDSKFALRFIERNADEVVRSTGFRNLSATSLVQILRSEKLEVEEVRLWQSIVPWTIKQLHEQGLEDTVENKRKVTKDIVPHIRFPAMQLSDIVTSVQPTAILPEGVLLKLFTYMASKGSSSETGEPDFPFPTKPRLGGYKKWTLSTTQKSSNITLSEKNTVASSSAGVYAYLVGDISFKKGKHAWRVSIRAVAASNQWILLGVGAKKNFTDNSSYSDGTVYGVTSCNNIYKGGAATTTTGTISFGTGAIVDVLFDVDARRLQYATSTGGVTSITDLPPPPQPSSEWAPHFILWQNNTIKVDPIPVSKFGKF